MKKKIVFILTSLTFGIWGYQYLKNSNVNPIDARSGRAPQPKSMDIKKMGPNIPNRFPAQSMMGKKILRAKAKVKMRGPSSSHPILDSYPRTKTAFENLYLLSNIVAEFDSSANNKITEVAGLSAYENSSDKRNIIYDASRGLYCVWTGIITLSAPADVVKEVSSKYPLSLQGSSGSTHFFSTTDGFDVTKHFPEIMAQEGISDVGLDLNYAKISAK